MPITQVMRIKARISGASVLSGRLVGLLAVVSVAAILLSKLVSGWSLGSWDVAWTSGSLAALAGMLLARRAAHADSRARWGLWAGATACWVAGQLAWDVYGLIGFPSSPNLADFGWWGFAGIVIVSLVRSRSRSRSLRIVTLVETVPMIAAAIALTFAELWHDASVSPLHLAPKLSALVYPAVYIAAAILMLQAMIGGSLRGSRSAALRLVMGGMAAQAVAFYLWSTQLLAGTYSPGATSLDPLWLAGLLAIAAGGTLAARRPDQAVEIHEPARHGGVLPATMFVLLIAALVSSHFNHAPTGVAITLGAGLLFSGAALILRGALLERRLLELLGRERGALSVLGDREAELARLNTQLVEDSRRDPLTGMRNRRALSDDLPQLEVRQTGPGRTFALALCDIDHFKAYNDRLGHLAGDQALRIIAATVRGAMRTGDVAYRFGGEELLLILRDVGAEAALAAAERVRLAVSQAAVPHPDGIDGILSVSIGVASGGEDSSTLLARADAALYDAKHAGRNCVLAAADNDPSVAAGRRHGVVEEPVPRHLRSMLAVSRAAASGHGPVPVLQALAETIRSELSFHVVAVNLLDAARQDLTCMIVLGDDDARQKLLGTVSPWSEWEAVMESGQQRCEAVWLPAGSSAPWADESKLWTPATAPAPGADGWQRDDMLLLPLRGQDGQVLGVVSVDQPVSGRRPDDGQVAFLMAVADYTGLALHQSQQETARSAAVQAQSAELRLAAAMLLAETLDLRDPGTALHSRTVGSYARQTAIALGLEPDRVEQIHAAGVLHDLGKLGIADAILYKPGPLDAVELREIKRHPEIGARILENAGLREIATWVRAHHERIDGDGYPNQLNSDTIALEARILAVADAYEAMVTDRPYRAGMAPEAARRELLRCAGAQFDPRVVDAFIGTLNDAGTAPSEHLRDAA